MVDKGRTTITEHIQNVFKENELVEKSVCREFRRTGSDGKEYAVKHYNLDVIISVGYRVKSPSGTQFRIPPVIEAVDRQYKLTPTQRTDML